jgi:hypothetical protein
MVKTIKLVDGSEIEYLSYTEQPKWLSVQTRFSDDAVDKYELLIPYSAILSIEL